MKPTSVMLLLAASLALCACGNKGSLVLPTEPEATTETPPADAGAEADPLPADQIGSPPPAVPPADTVPVQPTPEAPPDDTADDDPPRNG